MEETEPRADLAAYYGELLEEQVRSGLSVVDFAEEVGVSSATLYSWRRRLGRRQPTPKLIEVDVARGQKPIGGSMRLLVSERFSIDLRSGFDESALESLLRVLAGC